MKKGMTLTEILVVVSIIAFLTVLIVGFLRSQVLKGNDAKRKADINKIGIALEEYEKDNDCYPLPSLVVCKPSNNGLAPYLNNIPCDPISETSYYYETDGNLTCPRWYRLYAKLENEKDSDYVAGIGQDSLYTYYQSSPNAPVVETNTGVVEVWGCFGGSCQPISWDPDRPGPECDPSFQSSDCYDQCDSPLNECQDWNQ